MGVKAGLWEMTHKEFICLRVSTSAGIYERDEENTLPLSGTCRHLMWRKLKIPDCGVTQKIIFIFPSV